MKIHYMCCARSSSIDNTTRQLSLFHILDEISATSFPIQLAEFCVACLFERDPDDDQVQTYVMAISLDEALLASFAMRVEFGKGRRHRNVNNVQGLAIPTAGLVSVRIAQKTTILAAWQFSAIQTNAVMGAQPASPRTKPNDVTKPKLNVDPTIN